MMNRYLIGINTGGTYTDGVLLEYASRKLISSAKSLTRREDLRISVNKVLKKLDLKPHYDIKLVGISSTLATNTVAEGKGRRTGLLLIGYDRELLEQYALTDKMPAECIGYFSGGHTTQGAEAAPLDREGIAAWVQEHKHELDAVAVSSYFSPLNPAHEEAAFDIIREHSSLPVVMAQQLSTQLDSVKRAATASINASLVAVMHDFIDSVQHSLEELKINAPLMIVRGDGTLMPSEEAVRKPVETVLSGPAASAIGGQFLSGIGSSLVVDMGGTTTDMALVHDSRVAVTSQGARVGDYETAVKAARIRTISLGCDSRIHYNEKKDILLGPDRVRPLSQLAHHHRHVADELQELQNSAGRSGSLADLEYWSLYEPLEKGLYHSLSAKQKKVVNLLDQPRRLSDLIRKAGVYHVDHLEMDDLLHHGRIECAALTPSDLLHVDRRMNLWNQEAAEIALDYYCRIYGARPKEFIEKVFSRMTDVLVEEMIIYLACQNMEPSAMPAAVDGQWGRWMLQQILHSGNHFLSIDADSRYPVVGAGAPARFFLKQAARTLNAKFVLPDHFEVANAVGAVAGSVAETRETMVFVRDSDEQYIYIAGHEGRQTEFTEYEACCEFAEETARRLAREAALKAGATDCYVELERKVEGSLLRFTARALGTPGLSKEAKE